jgi:tryptophan synthase beta chain
VRAVRTSSASCTWARRTCAASSPTSSGCGCSARRSPVDFGTKTLKEATSEAIRDWIANVETTHYLIGSCVGPEPYPEIVAELQSVIGREAREQFLTAEGGLPEAVVACVGGGSNAIGIFHGFLDDADVRLVGVEGRGRSVARLGPRGRSPRRALVRARGRGRPDHRRALDLSWPRLSRRRPEHAFLRDTGRAEYRVATDEEALAAFRDLARTEGSSPPSNRRTRSPARATSTPS